MAIVIGITGGLSTGKTELGKILKSKDIPVMDLMEEIFKILSKDRDVTKRISKHKDGKYQKLIKTRNFKQLLQKLLDNMDDSSYFRNLLKPQLQSLLQEFITLNQDAQICAIISRNIFEDRLFLLCDYVVTVACDTKISEERFVKDFESDSYTYIKASNELIPNRTKEALADFVIYNSSTLVYLEKTMDSVIKLVT